MLNTKFRQNLELNIFKFKIQYHKIYFYLLKIENIYLVIFLRKKIIYQATPFIYFKKFMPALSKNNL